MTHPRDKVYRFATAAQWAAGQARGFVHAAEGATTALVTPGRYRAERVAGTGQSDAHARLARDVDGTLIWLRQDGTVWRLDDNTAFRIARMSRDLATRTKRFLWGQSTGWVLTDDALIRLDLPRAAQHGTFDDPVWRPEAIAADRCDGVIVVERERREGRVRLRRIRSDGQALVMETPLKEIVSVSAARGAKDNTLLLLIEDPDGWSIARQPLDDPALDREPLDPSCAPSGSLAAMPSGGLMIVTADQKHLVSAGLGHVGPCLAPQTDQLCGIGSIHDLIHDGHSLVAATSTGLWRISPDHADAPKHTATWVSPILRSPLGEPDGWQRADVSVLLPPGGEMTISAQGFALEQDAKGARANLLDADPLLTQQDPHPAPSQHFGVGQMTCRHYLGDIDAEYLILRVQITLPPCVGQARLNTLQVLYPNRSLIDDLPAIYSDDPVSSGQMRRSLAGFQALIDELDDTITAATSRLDPEKTDPLWAGFLLHWLGHGELARLLSPQRITLLRALPDIMQWRGTMRGLRRVMSILAPGAFDIEDSGAAADIWLLPRANDPAGARLGAGTRVGHTDPVPLALGGRTPLGTHVLGPGCGGAAPATCSADVTIRIAGGPGVEERLRPFTDAIARAFAPANTRLIFVFTDHVPPGRLGFGPGLGEITLDQNQSRALGQWELPDAGTPASPHAPAVLDHATLNGNLVLE